MEGKEKDNHLCITHAHTHTHRPLLVPLPPWGTRWRTLSLSPFFRLRLISMLYVSAGCRGWGRRILLGGLRGERVCMCVCVCLCVCVCVCVCNDMHVVNFEGSWFSRRSCPYTHLLTHILTLSHTHTHTHTHRYLSFFHATTVQVFNASEYRRRLVGIWKDAT